MKTRRIKTRKTRKMKGGIVLKEDGKWKVQDTGPTTPNINEYRILEASVLNELASDSASPDSNDVLLEDVIEKTYDRLSRECESDESLFANLLKLKRQIADIIHRRHIEGIDRFNPHETTEERIIRERHEDRLKRWTDKYTLIKTSFNRVRKVLRKPLEKQDNKRLTEQLANVKSNIVSVNEAFLEIIENLKGLKQDLSFILDSRAFLQSFKDKSAENNKMLDSFSFRFKNLTNVVSSNTTFSQQLSTVIESAPRFDESFASMVEFSASLDQFIEEKQRQHELLKETYAARQQKMEELIEHTRQEEETEDKEEKEEAVEREKSQGAEVNALQGTTPTKQGSKKQDSKTQSEKDAEDFRLIDESRKRREEEEREITRKRREEIEKKVAEERERIKTEQEAALFENVKIIVGLKGSLILTTNGIESTRADLIKTDETFKGMLMELHPDTRPKFQYMKKLFFSLSNLPKHDDKKREEMKENITTLEEEIKSGKSINDVQLSAIKDNIIALSSMTAELMDLEYNLKAEREELSKIEEDIKALPGYSEKVVLTNMIDMLEKELERIISAYPPNLIPVMRERHILVEEMLLISLKPSKERSAEENAKIADILAKLTKINIQIEGLDKRELTGISAELRIAKRRLSTLKGDPSDKPSEKAQKYKEANEEFERLIEIIRAGYLEQEAVIKEKAPDIEDLMEIREQLLRVLEMTAISGSKRKKKEKALEQNLKFIVEKNPSYLELVKELDEKLKEILKLGIKADKLEKYMQEHPDDIEYIIEPTKESAAEEGEGGGGLLLKQVKERGTRRKSVKKVEPKRYTRKKVRDSRA